MEYPTLITAGVMNMGIGLDFYKLGVDHLFEAVVVHEIGHQWWYAMVAFNEAEEPWLDEGFTDYSTVRLMQRDYGEQTSAVDLGNIKISYLDTRRFEYLSDPNLPMLGKAWDFNAMQYGVAAYSKPDVALTTLERVLGEETMLKLMSTFFQRYRYAHPTTQDFRQTAQEVAGKDLSWFFDGLVYGKGVLDYRVSAVNADSVTVQRQGDLVIPTEVLVTFTDGSKVREAWDGKQPAQTFTYAGKAPISHAEVDPDHKLVIDLAWYNNGLSRRADLWSWLALVTRLLYQLQNGLLSIGGI